MIVPTHEITLDWTNKTQEPTDYDSDLQTLELHSKDGFIFKLEVTQVINISSENAPKMISRVGSATTNILDRFGKQLGIGDLTSDRGVKYSSIQNLVSRVLEPMVGNYFRNAAQDFDALDFLQQRDQIQEGATEHIKNALEAYGVQAVGTFINEIDLPDELEKPIRDGNIAEIETGTLRKQTERVKQELKKEEAMTESQQTLIKAQQNRKIAESNAEITKREIDLEAYARQMENNEDLRKREREAQIEVDKKEREAQIEMDQLQHPAGGQNREAH